jgi:CspA family cold shock protein
MEFLRITGTSGLPHDCGRTATPSHRQGATRAEDALMRGTVKMLGDKGYGFIAPDDGSPDVFVHAKDLPRGVTELAIGEPVEFDAEPGKGGRPKATSIKVL